MSLEPHQSVIPLQEEHLKSIMTEGMYLAFVGETGCGKTTTITWYGYWLNEIAIKSPDIKLYTNYHLKNCPEEDHYWDWEFMSHPDELLQLPRYSIALLDDMWRWCLDSYDNRKKIMMKYDDIQASGRKRGYMILASVQRFMRLDPNFRFNIQYLIQPTLFYGEDFKPYRISVAVIEPRLSIIEDSFDYDPNTVFDLFETSEEIKPFREQEKFGYDKLADEFIKWNVHVIADQDGKKRKVRSSVNQDLVNLYLTESKLYEYMTKEERSMLRTLIKRKLGQI